jgi:hypothetical protein
MQTFWSAAAMGKHSKEHKNQPKIGEFLALKVVWTALWCIKVPLFNCV